MHHLQRGTAISACFWTMCPAEVFIPSSLALLHFTRENTRSRSSHHITRTLEGSLSLNTPSLPKILRVTQLEGETEKRQFWKGRNSRPCRSQVYHDGGNIISDFLGQHVRILWQCALQLGSAQESHRTLTLVLC